MGKYTYDFVKTAFESEGYKLLSNKYKLVSDKLKYECPNGHVYYITFDKWLRGHRCYYCNANIKLTTEYVSNELLKEGYTLLSEYINSKIKIKYKCPNGHIGFMRWDHWRRGVRCAKCAGNSKVDINVIKNSFGNENYKVLKIYSKNGRTRIRYECSNGHVNEIYYYNWSQGNRCPYCKRVKKKKLDDLYKEFSKEGYTLLSKKYINNKSKLNLICPNGHLYKVSWDEWANAGSRCPSCSKTGSSVQEDELYKFLCNYGSFVKKDRNLIKPLELDFVNYDCNIAIEYCGLYWHSSKYKDKYYHIDKLNRCNRNGFQLVTIFEDEWLFYTNICKNRLLRILGCYNNISSDNVHIQLVDDSLANKFVCNNSFKVFINGSINIGLYSNGKLMCILSFTNLCSYKWLLYDVVFLSNYYNIECIYNIINYFMENYKCDKLLYYLDRRWVYEAWLRRFKLVGYVDAKKWAIKKQRRYDNINLSKYVIYDCGYDVYEFVEKERDHTNMPRLV